jgi:putative hydrolase of the HAD superfamily
MLDAGVRAVFFDAVGTLLFPREPVRQTYAAIGRRHGSRLTETHILVPLHAAFARQEAIDEIAGWQTSEAREQARWRQIVAEAIPDITSEQAFADLWAHYSDPAAWIVHPQSADLLRVLTARGIHVGVGSNFDARLIELVDSIPALTPIRGRCVISSLVGWRKPDHRFFAAVVEAAGCQPDHILFVGDDLRNDVDGAIAAGLRAVLYDPDDRVPSGPRIRQLRDILPR